MTPHGRCSAFRVAILSQLRYCASIAWLAADANPYLCFDGPRAVGDSIYGSQQQDRTAGNDRQGKCLARDTEAVPALLTCVNALRSAGRKLWRPSKE